MQVDKTTVSEIRLHLVMNSDEAETLRNILMRASNNRDVAVNQDQSELVDSIVNAIGRIY